MVVQLLASPTVSLSHLLEYVVDHVMGIIPLMRNAMAAYHQSDVSLQESVRLSIIIHCHDSQDMY